MFILNFKQSINMIEWYNYLVIIIVCIIMNTFILTPSSHLLITISGSIIITIIFQTLFNFVLILTILKGNNS